MSQPRTWTLYGGVAGGISADRADPRIRDGEWVRVVELAPALDIIEPLLLAARGSGRLATHELLPAAAFLQAHGRWQLNLDGSLQADG